MRQSRLSARWVIVAVALCLAAACGQGKAEKVIIIGPSGQSDVNIYPEPGGEGRWNAQVSGGEFATVLDRRKVGSGEWMKIRTVINPREGWISTEFTRPAPSL